MKREPLATSGTPGQEAGGYPGGVHGMPYGEPPAIVLYPSKIRTTHGSGESLVDHSPDEERGAAQGNGHARTESAPAQRESIKMKALRRYSSIKHSVRQSVIGVAM